jgi:hypothetical protein
MFVSLLSQNTPLNLPPGEPRKRSDVLDLPPKTISPLYADMNDWEVKHTAKEILVRNVAMSDLMAARMSYSTPLSYSVRLMAITNGNFSTETQKEALQHGIRLWAKAMACLQPKKSFLLMLLQADSRI